VGFIVLPCFFSGEMSDFLSDRGVNKENPVFSGAEIKLAKYLGACPGDSQL